MALMPPFDYRRGDAVRRSLTIHVLLVLEY